MKRGVIIFSVVVMLAGCGTSYNPQRSAVATPLNQDTYRINTRGNAFTSMSTAQDYALLRASELAIQGGYPYFLILGQTNRVKKGSITTPGTYQSNTYGNATAYGTGNTVTAYGSATTYGTYTPSQTTNFTKPRSEVVVKLLKTKPDDPNVVVYDARLINQQLSGRVRKGSGFLGF